ncbi:Multidrug resistance-associated protein 1 [Araneus ventricosus]|uniref:ABC-type glutathione-S-conjugate transporter n=1 Tax=Araneus ventricosus TaxID=182803 RepID=A0A4Y2GHG8_ARAVE|nr:Multidrug resistance-associated protein 1 [Araneus ventricosus]
MVKTPLLDEFCKSPFWDDNLLWNSTNPDLTPCFEKTALAWIPCLFLWLFGPLECYFQRKSSHKPLPWTGANISRMVLSIVLGVLCALNILDELFNRRQDIHFVPSLIAESLKALTFVFALILMLFNRKKGRHTSGILFIFWLSLTFCEIFPYRTAFITLQTRGELPSVFSFVTHMIYFPILVAELILSCFADIRYRHPPDKEARKECPELRASFASKIVFWWFNGMSVLGWKRPLRVDDLWELNPDDRTDHIAAQFEKHYRQFKWAQPVAQSKIREEAEDIKAEEQVLKDGTEYIVRNGHQDQPKEKIHILRSLYKTFAGSFITGSILKLIYDLLQFINPLILKSLIEYVKSDEPLWIGVLFAALIFLNCTLQSVVLGSYFHRMFIIGMRVRTALVTAVYKKSLVLSSTARKESTVGEIVNLMSVDSQRFMDLMTYLNLIWSAPLQIVVALLMLFNVLGIAVLSGLFVSIVLIPINAFLGQIMKKRQVKQMKYKDERVKLVNEVLSGIKVLKLYAWEEAFREKINAIRDKEIKNLKSIAYLNSLTMMIWSCSPFLVALVSFATYVLIDENNHLDAATAFVSLSLFNILRFPLTMLPHLITTMILVSVSVKRLNKYMNSEELDRYVTYDPSNAFSLTVNNGEFTWDPPKEEEEKEKAAKPTLTNIQLLVPRGSLIAIVGQVGSGKSSLFSAILGEMTKLSGSVTFSGKIAYASQQPWIQNTSLKNNILFSKPLSKHFYEDVLEACGLKPDLEILPGGDQTEIGEKGINLSGGQKQRVSLARAVYASADIYLLDDPLSAVDSHVGKHIFDKVIGPSGLLKTKTRILVTHSLTYLPQTDVIYVMKDGTIAEKGSFQELVESKGPFAEYLAQYGSQIESEDLSDIPPELIRSLSHRSNEGSPGSDLEDSQQMTVMSINRQPSVERSRSLSRQGSMEKRSNSLSNSIDMSASLPKDFAKLINIEAAETGQVKMSVYMEYFKAVGHWWVAVIVIAYIVWQAFAVYSNIWLSEWGTDKPLNGTEEKAQRDYRLGVFGALGIGQSIGIFVGSFAVAYGTLAASNSLHDGILLNVLKSPMSFFDTTPLGRIVNRFSKDVDTVDVTIPTTLRSWLSCLLQVISTLIVISVQTPIFLVVVVPISVIYYFIQRFYLSTSRQLKRLESITRSPIYSHFSETLSGASTIRAYKAEERFCTQSNTFVDNNQICYFPSIVSNRWLAIRLDFCGNFIIFFAALFAVLQKDSLDAGKVGLSVTYALMVTSTINWLVRMSSELETNIVAVERILEYTNTPTEAPWVIEGKTPPKEWPDRGTVKMDNYSTRYRTGLDLVLKQISCDVKSGEKIGIVGRTGAGKSSLTLCLFRIIEAADGKIELDDLNIADMGLHDLRSKITIIPQDPVLFSGTLRMNLDPFNWYSDAQLWGALDHAHLKNFVSTLQEGLEHEVVEGGENLSVGQRQLVCLARALLRKTKILVLDEATAAVDLETDSLIQETIRTEFKDASVLTIAHRLNTVMDYDRIMVLDQGRVAEFDSPETLLKNKNSIFYGMAKDAGIV